MPSLRVQRTSLRQNRAGSIIVAALFVLGLAVPPVASAAIPDPTTSYYVPQGGMTLGGTVENVSPPPTPPTGPTATGGGAKTASRLFRGCPNNDGGTSYPNGARIKIVVLDNSSTPISGIPAGDVCIVVNGGTAAQMFGGGGADSVIANGTLNPGCPDFPSYGYSPPDGRCISADGPTNSAGVTYITLAGGTWDGTTWSPLRSAARKWGHYDSDLAVYVQGIRIFGAWNSSYAPPATPFPSYELRIKSIDWAGGLANLANQGEMVTALDFNGVANGIGINNVISYWKDFDFSGDVLSGDLNLVTNHLLHNCSSPLNP